MRPPLDPSVALGVGDVRDVDAPLRELPPFEQVFTDHAPGVWRILRRLGVLESDIKDVCQEVFIDVHRKFSTYDGRCSIRTWLYGFCIRKAAKYRRAPRYKREELVEALPEQGEPASQEDELDRRAALLHLDAMLDTLDDDKRTIFVLYCIEQMPMSEIAELVGCPLQTAYSRCSAARAQIEAAARRLRRSRR